MKTVDRFLLKGFFAKTLLMLFLLVGVFLLSEALTYGRHLGQENFNLTVLAQYLGLNIPGIFAEMAPFGVLLGTLVFLGELSRHAELTALRAGGLSMTRIVRPLLLGGALVAAATFVLEDRVAGRLEPAAERLLNERLGKRGSGQWLGQGGVWLRDEARVVSASRVSRTGEVLSGVTIFRLDGQGLVKEVLNAERLVFRQEAWWLTEADEAVLDNLKTEDRSGTEVPLQARPEVMAELGSSPKRMGFLELWGYVEQLRRQGQPTAYLDFSLWQKITRPLACIVMVLVVSPFVPLTARSGSGVGRLLVGIGLGMAFYASNVLVEQLSVAGGVPPPLAAWLPLVTFTGLGTLMLYRRR